MTECIPYLNPYYYMKHNGDDAHQNHAVSLYYLINRSVCHLFCYLFKQLLSQLIILLLTYQPK